jgi:hypothetical protein
MTNFTGRDTAMGRSKGDLRVGSPNEGDAEEGCMVARCCADANSDKADNRRAE